MRSLHLDLDDLGPVRALVVLSVAAWLLSACVSQELKAPCGPLTSYAEGDDCGEALPVNDAFVAVGVEVP